MGPLDGIRIIDMSSVLMGPLATQTLGDYGADIIKVEAPVDDIMRQVGPMRNASMGPMFLNVNRSKRSICLDLKNPAGRDVLLRLVKDADILVYNVRPRAMARLGLDYESICAVNPSIVYAGLFGYGQDGPYAPKPAYDDLIQGGALVPHLSARASGGEPRYAPNALADRVVGHAAVGAILATLVHRLKTGEGQKVEIPMFETMVQFILGDHLSGLTFDPPLDEGGYRRQLSVHRRPFPTSDGYVCALIYSDDQWRRFLKAIGEPEALANHPDFQTFADRQKHIDAYYESLIEVFRQRSSREWIDLLEAADLPVMPMHDFQSILDDPHLQANGFFQMVDHPSEGRMRTMRVPASWSATPTGEHRHAPQKGEHSIEVLKDAGYSADEIKSMLDENAVQVPADDPLP